ncbi:TPA: hypothetical protein EYP27_01485, partial [Candidatus Bathyarchaeota archaeon]|nr:hypothetical protein [Candidatus Bathyarchaeota archaeon]
MVGKSREVKSKVKLLEAKLIGGKIILDLKESPQAEALVTKGYGEKTNRKRKLELAPWEALH